MSLTFGAVTRSNFIATSNTTSPFQVAFWKGNFPGNFEGNLGDGEISIKFGQMICELVLHMIRWRRRYLSSLWNSYMVIRWNDIYIYIHGNTWRKRWQHNTRRKNRHWWQEDIQVFSPYKDPMVTGLLSYICTLSQTNSKFAPEHGWLDDWGFLLGNPFFLGAMLVFGGYVRVP